MPAGEKRLDVARSSTASRPLLVVAAAFGAAASVNLLLAVVPCTPTRDRGSGAATAGLVELAAVTLGGAARTRAAGTTSREGIAGRRRRAAVDQARSGQLGTDAAAGQPGNLDDPLPTPEPSPDRIADVDRRGGLGPLPVDLHVPGPARLRGQGTCLHQPHRPQPAVDPRAVHAPIVTRAAACCLDKWASDPWPSRGGSGTRWPRRSSPSPRSAW